MKRFMFFAVSAFWGSVLSIWAFAQLATEDLPDAERRISQEELARHSSPDDCWMAIDVLVYDFSDYLERHPTPPAVMTPWCGKDATEPYRTKGYGRPHSPAADAMLPGYQIGRLTSGSKEEG